MTKKLDPSTVKLIKAKKPSNVGRKKHVTKEIIYTNTNLTGNQEEFAKQYVLTKRNGTDSVLKAYPNVNSKNVAASMANDLLKIPKVQARIAELQKSVEETLGTSLPWVANEVAKMVTRTEADNAFKLECLRYLGELMGHNNKGNTQIVMQQNNLFQETQDEFKGKMG